MKTFKNFEAFEKRVQKAICWDDYFQLDGKMWNIYEYGGGSMMHLDYDYVYFLNKKSGNMIYVKYHCPSYSYINGEKNNIKNYQFISVELIENATKWR